MAPQDFRFNFSPNSNPWSNIVFGNQDDDEEDNNLDLGPMGSSPYIRQINELMARRQPAMERYLQNMAAAPTRAQYKPGKLTSIGAILAGVGQSLRGDPNGGFETMQAIQDLPYRRAYEEWAMRDKSLGAGAKLENEQLKQSAENLLKMADDEVKRKNANASAARARASMSTAGTYKTMVEQPHWAMGGDADNVFAFNTKDTSFSPIYGGRSAASAQRTFQATQNALNRGVTVSEGAKNREAAGTRAAMSLFRPRRTTISKTVPAVERKRNETLAMMEAQQHPDWAQGAKAYIIPDPNNKGMLMWNPPPNGASNKEWNNYKKLRKHIETRTNQLLTQTVDIPSGYEMPDWFEGYNPSFMPE